MSFDVRQERTTMMCKSVEANLEHETDVPCNNSIAQLVQALPPEFLGIGLLHAIPQIDLHMIPTICQRCCRCAFRNLHGTFQHRSNCAGHHCTPAIHKKFMPFGADQPNICAFALTLVHSQQKSMLKHSMFRAISQFAEISCVDVACSTCCAAICFELQRLKGKYVETHTT